MTTRTADNIETAAYALLLVLWALCTFVECNPETAEAQVRRLPAGLVLARVCVNETGWDGFITDERFVIGDGTQPVTVGGVVPNNNVFKLDVDGTVYTATLTPSSSALPATASSAT